MSAICEIRNLSVHYGGVAAVSDVSFGVEQGTFVGLIGPNGAGKTTLIDAVTGFTPSSGEVLFEGEEINGWPTYRRARRGLTRTFQGLELFEDLTVRENLLVAADRPRWWSLAANTVRPRGDAAAGEAADEALELLGITATADYHPDDLSLGQRKLVTVARGLACRPKLLLLDEPAAGLDSSETLELGGTLKKVVESGVTVLLVDHDMGLVLGVCDVIHVLEFGKLIASGTAAEIRSDERVIHAYLGGGEAVAQGADA
jgi:ABC-type branched-subunit amino acid transport system ATPase component